MGGGGSSHDGDVEERARSSSTFQEHAQTMRNTAPRERKCHPSLDPRGKTRECRDTEEHPATTPILVLNDLTESRGQDTEIIYAESPKFMRQTVRHAYATDAEFCMSGFGDTYSDIAPPTNGAIRIRKLGRQGYEKYMARERGRWYGPRVRTAGRLFRSLQDRTGLPQARGKRNSLLHHRRRILSISNQSGAEEGSRR